MEKWHRTNMFISSEIQCQKTNIVPTWILHQRSCVRKPISGLHVFYMRKATLKNWRWANVIFFIRFHTLEKRPWVKVFFQWKSNVRKPTSGQCGYSFRNPTSEYQQWANVDVHPTYYFRWKPNVWNSTLGNVFFSLEIRCQKTNVGQTFFFSASYILCWEINIIPTFFLSETRRQKTELTLTCFFHPKSNIRKVTSSAHVFFIRNTTLKNRRHTNVFFSLEIRRQKRTSA